VAIPRREQRGRPPSSPGSFDVVFVCTGNRFRSALAEAAFRAATDGLPVRVESYGTLELGAVAPLAGALREGEVRGLDLSAHLAKSLHDADLSQASLVVGFEREHAIAAVEVARARPERVFVLAELLQQLEHIDFPSHRDPVERAVRTVARAAERRRHTPSPWSGREIDDPIGLPDAAQSAIAELVHRGAETLARRLFDDQRTVTPR
jgi:protein-tyrosine-phosphatase